MSRVTGATWTKADFPYERLVFNYDEQQKIIECIIPSLSDKSKVYQAEIDCTTGESACGCPAFLDFREGSKMPYRFENACTDVEALAKAKGYHLAPLITRNPRALCPHLRRARQALKRRGLMPAFLTIENSLRKRVEALPSKKTA